MTATEKSSFGALLRRHRHAAGLTQEELAERAEVSVRQLAYLEQDRHVPRPGTIRRLGEALGLSEEEHAALLATVQQAVPERPTAARVSLPVPPTPFIGRKQEVVAVANLIGQESVRLVTLTGPGGMGKTRLAIEAAQRLCELFPDGAVLVPLGAVSDPALVPAAIAAALGVEQTPGRPVIHALTSYLREKRLLLLLDNFEHLLATTCVVSDLLAACPRLKVLVTSRAVLRLAAEHDYAVPPLTVPDADRMPVFGTLIQYDAVALFVERAGAAKAGFSLTGENASTVVEICRRLDGLPLAIELAAARVPLFPPRALLRRLTPALQLLTGGARDAPARQQTLRSTIDWSYGLLEATEQTLFARLSVFVGGCTLDAVEAVCKPQPDAGIGVLEGVASLVEKSLLHSSEGRQGEPRFTMLETIREYAREKLEASDEADTVWRRHAEHFTQLAEHADVEMSLARTDGLPSMSALGLLEEEQHNLDAALAWSVEHGQAELGLRLAGALRHPWFSLGREIGMRSALEALLPRRGSVPPPVLAKALIAAEMFGATGSERHGQQGSQFDEAISICRRVGDKQALLVALLDVGGHQLYHGGGSRACLDHAEALYEEALSLAREVGSSSAVGASLRGLGTMPTIAGVARDDPERARVLFEESLSVERAASNTLGIAYSLHALAWRALKDRDGARAAALAEHAIRTYRDAGMVRQVGEVRRLQGIAALMKGDHAGLYATFRASSSEAHFGRFTELDADWLVLVAASWAAQGMARRAARLAAAARLFDFATTIEPVLPTALGWFTWLLQGCLSVGRSQVDEATWQAAWEEGLTMTLQEAVAYALDEGNWNP